MRILTLLVAVVLVACGDDGTSGTCDDRLLAGDLVITEVFADFAAAPGGSGVDEGNEWFEIHNTSSRPLDLTGLTLEHSRGDGSMGKQGTLTPITIAPGDYLVLGNVLADLAPAWVDAGYADRLGDLYNTGTGRIALRCGTTQIDEAFYADVKPGESRQLDGGAPPDYTVNDDLVNWCKASHTPATEFSPGNYGTPGSANEDCEIIVSGMCDDGVSLRPIVSPAPGDLVITEIMPSPAAVDDALGEWFEIKVNRDVDLNGLGIDRMGDTANPTVVQAERCLSVTTGSLIVFARSADPGENGGLPTVTGTFTHTMIAGSTTTPGDVAILIGTTVIDTFSWTASRSGKSLQVDPDFANVTENDDQTRWCDGTQTYGEGDFGTPGTPNAQCAAVAPPGTCLDGTTSRPVLYPDVGDLVITEVMPSPNAVSDTTGEWFEVLATTDVDLNGLGLDRASDTANPNVISSAACLRLATGERALFARSSVSEVNGGLPPVTGGFTFSLITGSATTPGDVQLVLGTDVLDAVTWTHSTGGASLSLDPDFSTVLDNDVEANWCDAVATYGAGDRGTPGAANEQCTGGPAPGTCLDGGTARATVAPVSGDLVITEVMPNPSAVSDTTGEWFEVLVTRDVDLNGVGLDRAGDTAGPVIISQPACVRVMTGSRLVFARSADGVMNGGLPPITATFSFALIDGTTAAPGDVQLVLGPTTLDSITWTSTTTGASHQVDPDFETVTGNDLAANRCTATLPYGAGDLGTPGLANTQCVTLPPPGTCDDGGTIRAIVKPAAGQLVITEFLANPANITGFTDAQREWFEIQNTGATAFDLNELELARTGANGNVIQSAVCKPVAAAGYALLARSADPLVNAMLPTVDATFTFALVDTAGNVEVRDGATILDVITYPSVTSGAAKQLDPDLTTVTDNDTPTSFCNATATYGDASNTGTPRAANAQCP
jgi:hypothetical protein